MEIDKVRLGWKIKCERALNKSHLHVLSINLNKMHGHDSSREKCIFYEVTKKFIIFAWFLCRFSYRSPGQLLQRCSFTIQHSFSNDIFFFSHQMSHIYHIYQTCTRQRIKFLILSIIRTDFNNYYYHSLTKHLDCFTHIYNCWHIGQKILQNNIHNEA